jgi:hypothetical protein
MLPTSRRDLTLCLLVGTLLVTLVWAEPRPIDDLFIALAGGRDALAGRLGAPDDWSFTTAGRVWLNQNWGSGVLFAATYAVAGETGLLVLKALLLLVIAAAIAFAARARNVGWPLAVLVATATLAASRSYLDLRPALVSLGLVALLDWVLSRAATRPRSIWLALPLIAVWANVHGGFIFGLGLLTLWTALVAVTDARARPAAIATLAASLAAAAFLNPFGITNLTHPFVVAAHPAWRTVAEWVPLFGGPATSFGSRWEECVFAGVLLALVVARLVVARRGSQEAHRRSTYDETVIAPQEEPRGRALFDVAAALVVVVMAVRARRFVPLALVVLAPLLAAELEWWQRRLASSWPSRALAVGSAIAALVAAPPVARRYAPANPVFAGRTIFGRMIDEPTFPTDAAAFLRDNHIGGRAYAAWEWEGYLRWTNTPVTVLIGGRAQQVYDEATLALHEGLRTGAVDARTVLGSENVGLAILPLTAPYAEALNGLVYSDDTSWAYLYSDGRHAVLIDTAHPDLAAAAAALQAGTLRYPNAATAATSRMMYLASPHTDADLDALRTAAETAARTAPSSLAYAVIGDVATSGRSSAPERAWLAGERERLDALAADQPEDFALAQARLAEARIEWTLLARTVDPAGTARARDALMARTADMRALLRRWAYGWDPDVF